MLRYKEIKFQTHFFPSKTIEGNIYLVARYIDSYDNNVKYIYISYNRPAMGISTIGDYEELIEKKPILYISDFLSIMKDTPTHPFADISKALHDNIIKLVKYEI